MIEVWGRTSSFNVQKVTWCLGELNVAYKRYDAGGAYGGLDSDDYGVMNPNRRIPTLKDGDSVHWESNSVIRYLAATYDDGGLWPTDPKARSLADRWMDWQIATLQPQLHPIFWGLIRTPEKDRDMPGILAAVEAIKPMWLVLDDHLSGRSFVAGNELTMGDIPLGCAYWRYINLPIDRPPLANCQLWFQALKGRQAYRDNVMLEVV